MAILCFKQSVQVAMLEAMVAMGADLTLSDDDHMVCILPVGVGSDEDMVWMRLTWASDPPMPGALTYHKSKEVVCP